MKHEFIPPAKNFRIIKEGKHKSMDLTNIFAPLPYICNAKIILDALHNYSEYRRKKN